MLDGRVCQIPCNRVTWCNSNVKKEIILKLLNPAEHNFCPFANLL